MISAYGSAESSIRFTLTMDFWSLARRNGKSCFRSPSPMVTVNASKPGHSGLGESWPMETGTSGGNLYVARIWRSIVAAISVGLGWEEQFRPMSDKRMRQEGMSNRDNTFTWTHLCCWIYQQNYLMGTMTPHGCFVKRGSLLRVAGCNARSKLADRKSRMAKLLH